MKMTFVEATDAASHAKDVTTHPIGAARLRSSRSSKRDSAQSRLSISLGVLHYDSVDPLPRLDLDSLDISKVPWWTSKRLRLSVLSFFGFVCVYAQRVNLSIAIVAMVSHKNDDVFHRNESYSLSNESKTVVRCPTLSKSEKDAEFHWDKHLQGLILGSFFWGYLSLQVAGGRLAEIIGAKKVMALGMFPVAILTILTPAAARTSPYLLMALRVCLGLCQSPMYPSAQALWARWAPPNERAQLIGISYSGGQFGNALMLPVAGVLCEHGFDGGWPTVFYFIGSVGFIWACLWMLFAYDSPDEHPTISEIEKKYINMSLGITNSRNKIRTKKPPVPWCCVLKSCPFWAILVGHTSVGYGAYMMLTKIPTYMKEVLKFDIKANGLYSMLPYVASWGMTILCGILADTLVSRAFLSVKGTRRLFACLGFIVPALTLIGVGFMECDQARWAVLLLTVSVGFWGFQISSVFVSHSDIAPKFAGTLFGLTNMVATITGIVAPVLVSAMTPNGTREEWLITFYLAAGIYVFGCIFYCVFGRTEVQPWALDSDQEDPKRFVGKSTFIIGEGATEIL